MVQFALLQILPLGCLSIIIPKASTVRVRDSSDPTSCHGRTASHPTAPAQIPASGTTALGSSEMLASVADPNPYKPISHPLFSSGRPTSVSLCTLHLMVTHLMQHSVWRIG